MPSKPIIYAMIPARIGSTRLKMKNLALINGKPLIYYAIQAAKESGVFDKIIINSDHKVFSEIADRYNVGFYLRSKKLGSSTTKSDDVVADFMNVHSKADIVSWVNTTSPFQRGSEVAQVINYFLGEKLDSLITVETKQVHTICDGKPVNYFPDESFAQTQDLVPIMPFVYSVMMWRADCFLQNFTDKGHAMICGKFDVYPVNKMTAFIIKTEEDLKMVDLMMRAVYENGSKNQTAYDQLIKSVTLH